MEKLVKEIWEFKEFLVEDLTEILKEEIKKDIEAWLDVLWDRNFPKEPWEDRSKKNEEED